MSDSEISLLSGPIHVIGVLWDSPLIVQVRIWSIFGETDLSMNCAAEEKVRILENC